MTSSGLRDHRSIKFGAAPFEAAFAVRRRAQLGVDGGALGQAARSITPEQLAAAAKLFDTQNSAAIVTGGKI